jgi:hypothetical protein
VGVYFSATVAQGLLVLNYSTYDFQRWHGILLWFTGLVFCVLVNLIGVKLLPMVKNRILILHIMGFFAVLIPLVYLASHEVASYVGWSNSGLT